VVPPTDRAGISRFHGFSIANVVMIAFPPR
jgi:hypothetical protein